MNTPRPTAIPTANPATAKLHYYSIPHIFIRTISIHHFKYVT